MATTAGVSLGKDGTIVANRPVVTFNEQYGAGAAYVAERVAERLGVPYLASKFSSEEIETIDRAAEADSSGSNRFVWDMAHASSGVGADMDSSAAGDAEARTAIIRDNTRELLDMVRGGGGAIVGRDATVVLAGVQGAYHVRLEAPVGTRIQRAAEAAGISQEVAARRQAREDQFRTEMSMRLMRWTPSNREHYDLVVDTGRTSLDDAVDQIVADYQSKHPDI